MIKFNKERFYKDYKEDIQDDGNIYVIEKDYNDDSIVYTIEDFVENCYYMEDSLVSICFKKYVEIDFNDIMTYTIEEFTDQTVEQFNNDNHIEITKYINDYLKKNNYYDFGVKNGWFDIVKYLQE